MKSYAANDTCLSGDEFSMISFIMLKYMEDFGWALHALIHSCDMPDNNNPDEDSVSAELEEDTIEGEGFAVWVELP